MGFRKSILQSKSTMSMSFDRNIVIVIDQPITIIQKMVRLWQVSGHVATMDNDNMWTDWEIRIIGDKLRSCERERVDWKEFMYYLQFLPSLCCSSLLHSFWQIYSCNRFPFFVWSFKSLFLQESIIIEIFSWTKFPP